MTTICSGRPLLLAAAGALLAALSSCEGQAAPRTHTIIIDKMKFGPAPSNIAKGDIIVWENRDMFKHTATAKDKSFNLDLPPRSKGKTVVKRAGLNMFYCIYHPGMKGAFKAKE